MASYGAGQPLIDPQFLVTKPTRQSLGKNFCPRLAAPIEAIGRAEVPIPQPDPLSGPVYARGARGCPGGGLASPCRLPGRGCSVPFTATNSPMRIDLGIRYGGEGTGNENHGSAKGTLRSP